MYYILKNIKIDKENNKIISNVGTFNENYNRVVFNNNEELFRYEKDFDTKLSKLYKSIISGNMKPDNTSIYKVLYFNDNLQNYINDVEVIGYKETLAKYLPYINKAINNEKIPLVSSEIDLNYKLYKDPSKEVTDSYLVKLNEDFEKVKFVSEVLKEVDKINDDMNIVNKYDCMFEALIKVNFPENGLIFEDKINKIEIKLNTKIEIGTNIQAGFIIELKDNNDTYISNNLEPFSLLNLGKEGLKKYFYCYEQNYLYAKKALKAITDTNEEDLEDTV